MLVVEEGCRIEYSRAYQDGAFIYASGGQVDLISMTIIHSIARLSGGAMRIDGTIITMRDSSMSHSTSQYRGGAGSISAGRLTLIKSNILDSLAWGAGGAFFASGGVRVVGNESRRTCGIICCARTMQPKRVRDTACSNR